MSKINLLGLEFKLFLEALEKIKFRHEFTPSSIWKSIYSQGYSSFDEMSSISKHERQLLNDLYTLDYGTIKEHQISKIDSTEKYLLNYGSNANIETVYIPSIPFSNSAMGKSKTFQSSNEDGRIDVSGTCCVSSQVGCSLACKFCHTGTQKLLRNLSSGEIVAQVMHVMKSVKDLPLNPKIARKLTNIVMMGQGEPLLNYKNLSKAVGILTSPKGLNFASWRITISTSGIAPLIENVSKELKCGLAISLHAVTNDVRDHLVPINKQYPIHELLSSCDRYLNHFSPVSRHRRITFEYVMLDNVNDSVSEAKQLCRLIGRFPAHVNLIPFNPWPGSEFQSSSDKKITDFRNVVKNAGIPCTIRTPRGLDIMAACGQLVSSKDKKTIRSINEKINIS